MIECDDPALERACIFSFAADSCVAGYPRLSSSKLHSLIRGKGYRQVEQLSAVRVFRDG